MDRFHNQSVSDADTDDLLSGVEPLENVTMSSYHSSPTRGSPVSTRQPSPRMYTTLENLAAQDKAHTNTLYPSYQYTEDVNVKNLLRLDAKGHNSMPATPYEMYKDYSKEVSKRYAASVDQKKSVLPDIQQRISPSRENLMHRFEESTKHSGRQDLKLNYDQDKVKDIHGTKDVESQDTDLPLVDPDDPSPRSFADSILKSAYHSNMSATELEELSVKKSPPRSNKKVNENIQETEYENRETFSDMGDDIMAEQFPDPDVITQKHTRSLTSDNWPQNIDSRSPKSRHTRSSTVGKFSERSSNPSHPLTRRAASDIGQLHNYDRPENVNTYSYSVGANSYLQSDLPMEPYTEIDNRLKGFKDNDLSGVRDRVHNRVSYSHESGRQQASDHRTMSRNVGTHHNLPRSVEAVHDTLQQFEDYSQQRHRADKHVSSTSIEDMESVRNHLHTMLTANAQKTRFSHENVMDTIPTVNNTPRDNSFESVSTLIENRLRGLPNMSQHTEHGWGEGLSRAPAAGSLPSGLNRIDNTLFSENTTLRESLEKERTRRKHCEASIQQLQGKILESQQQLAIAVSTEKKKDIMIEQLDKTLAKVVEGWKKRESEREEMTVKVEEDKRKLEEIFNKDISKLNEQIRLCENEVSQEKKKTLQALDEKEAQIRLHETERDRLSELVESERERIKRVENERDRANKGKEHVAKQLETLQKTLDDERNTWLDRERELKDLLDDARESQHQLIAREKDKLDEQQRLNRDTQDALNTAQKEIQHLQMDVDSVSRERDHMKVELGLMEARIENNRQKIEAEIRADFEKQAAQQIAESHKKMSSYEGEIRENHRHQINELTQKHAEEIRLVQEQWRNEMQQKEAKFAENGTMYDDRLKEARTEITQLRLDKQKLEVQRNDITKRLQSMMQTHCNEALGLLLGAKVQPEPSVSDAAVNSTVVSGVEPLSTDTIAYVDKYLKSLQQNVKPAPSYAAQPEIRPVNHHEIRHQMSSTVDAPNKNMSAHSYTQNYKNVGVHHVPTMDNSAHSLAGQTLPRHQQMEQGEEHRRIGQQSQVFYQAPSSSQTDASYSVYTGSSGSMVTAKQGLSSTDIDHTPVKAVPSSASTGVYTTPAYSPLRVQQSSAQAVRYPPLSSYSVADISGLQPSYSSHGMYSNIGTGTNRLTVPSTHSVPASIPSSAGMVKTGIYDRYTASTNVITNHHGNGSTVDRKEEDDSISVISSLLNEPIKTNYGETSDNLSKYEDRQVELQHYIQKLLDKSPGEASQSVKPASSVNPVLNGHAMNVNPLMNGQGVNVNPVLNVHRQIYTPPVKQGARMETSSNVERLGQQATSARTNMYSTHGEDVPPLRLNYSTHAGEQQSGVNRSYASDISSSIRGPQVPEMKANTSFSTDVQITSKPKAFVKSTVPPKVTTQPPLQQTRALPSHHSTRLAPSANDVLSPQQASEIKHLLDTYGNPAITNLPRIEDLMLYLQNIQASQSGTDQQELSTARSQQSENKARRNLSGRYVGKPEGSNTTKVRSPRSQKSISPLSSRKSPRQGSVLKAKNMNSVKDKKPSSARGKPGAPVWK